MAEKTPRDLILWFFLGLLLVSILLLVWILWPFASVIVLGGVATGVFSPLYQRLCRRIRPTLASLITCLIIFVVLFIPVVFFVTVVSREAYDLYLTAKSAVLSEEIGTLRSRLNELIGKNELLTRVTLYLENFGIEVSGAGFQQSIADLAKSVGLILYEQSSFVATNILEFLFKFFSMLLVCYYLLLDKNRLIAFIIDLSPLPSEQDEKLIQKFKDMAGAILVGNGLSGALQGVLCGGAFAMFGLSSPFLWGVVMGFLAFLPIVGIGAVMIPTSILLFLKGRIVAGIFFLIFYVIVSGGTEYILKPMFVGQKVKMHTLLVFFSIMSGLKLFGILGIVYGPLVVTAFLTLADIYYSNYRKLVEPIG